MDENLELNFLLNQQRANNNIRAFAQQQISHLLSIVHEQRLLVDQLEQQDREINIRINALGIKNKTIVRHEL